MASLLLLGAAFIALSCSNSPIPAAAIGAGSSVQAAYNRLQLTSDAAWSAAVASEAVRGGSIIAKTAQGFDTSVLSGLGATQTGQIAVKDGTWWHLAVLPGTERSVIASLRAAPGVMVAEPENVLHIPANEKRAPAAAAGSSAAGGPNARALGGIGVLNDPYVAAAEYSLSITDAIQAYSANPLVGAGRVAYAAVIDTGINLPHQEFIDNGASIVVRAMSAFTQSSTTSYSYVGDNKPFVAVPAGSNWDDDGHGSHVAGIMGALGNNGLGMAGVMWKGLRLISYKVLTDNENPNDSTQGSGGDWAVYGSLKDLADWWSGTGSYTTTGHAEAPGQVTLPVNMSLGSMYASSFEIEMLAYALADNVLVFTAMGNDGRTVAEYPAAYTGVVAIGATNGTDSVAAFSTTGDWMSVCAPGFDIISTFNGSSSNYEWMSGTSMATPFVTGLAAYILAYAPGLAPDQVKAIIEQTADKIGGAVGYTPIFGNGRVNVASALALATSSPPPAGSSYSLSKINIFVTVGGTIYTGGQEVYLYDSTGGFVETGITDPSGEVTFALLKPGNYVAKATGSTVSAASVSTGTLTLVAGPGASDLTATIAL